MSAQASPEVSDTGAPTSRIAYFEGIRGVAIIAVVAIHSLGSGSAGAAHELSDPSLLFSFVLKQALLFAVPVFFFLSGYFASASTGQRLLRIGIPYVFWSIVASILLGERDPQEILGKLLTGRALGPYYFMLDLLILIALTPVIARALRHPAGLPLCFGIGLLNLALCYVALAVNPTLNWWWYMISPAAWLPYYALGMSRKLAAPEPSASRIRMMLALALGGIVLSCLEGFALFTRFGPGGGVLQPVKLSSMLYALVVCELILGLRGRIRFPPWLCWIGSASFGIYLLHEIFRSRIYELMREIPVISGAQTLIYAATIAVTIAFCIIIVEISRIFLTKSVSQRTIGL